MDQDTLSAGQRERLIAGLLRYGTWLASALIAAGLVLGLVQHDPGSALVKAGLVLFILLPLARVVLLVVSFLRERDHMYTAISALVLIMIAAGLLAGV